MSSQRALSEDKPWEAQLTLLSVGSMSEVSVLRQSSSQTCNMWRVRIEPTTSGFETYVVKNSGNYQPCVEHGSICAVGVTGKEFAGSHNQSRVSSRQTEAHFPQHLNLTLSWGWKVLEKNSRRRCSGWLVATIRLIRMGKLESKKDI